MNRHQRRVRSARAPRSTISKLDWARGIHDVSAEAAGVMEILVVRPCEMIELMVAALFDDRSARLASLVTRTVLNVHKAPVHDPVQCLACRRPMVQTTAFSVVMALPRRDDPAKAVVSAMCSGCGIEPDEITEKAVEAFRSIWPDARPIEVGNHKAGHA